MKSHGIYLWLISLRENPLGPFNPDTNVTLWELYFSLKEENLDLIAKYKTYCQGGYYFLKYNALRRLSSNKPVVSLCRSVCIESLCGVYEQNTRSSEESDFSDVLLFWPATSLHYVLRPPDWIAVMFSACRQIMTS